MRKAISLILGGLLASYAAISVAATDDYNNPGNDKIYLQCLRDANNRYEGGNAASPVRGQTKVQAWCTCMWNETPDDFKGSLVKFAEVPRGAATNKLCEKHSNWSE